MTRQSDSIGMPESLLGAQYKINVNFIKNTNKYEPYLVYSS